MSSPAPGGPGSDRERDSPVPGLVSKILARPTPKAAAAIHGKVPMDIVNVQPLALGLPCMAAAASDSSGGSVNKGRTGTATSSSGVGGPGVIAILKRETDLDSDRKSQKSQHKVKHRISSTAGAGGSGSGSSQNEKDEDKDAAAAIEKSSGIKGVVLASADSAVPIEPGRILVGRKTITKNTPVKPSQPEQPPSIFDLLQPYKFPGPKAIPLIDNSMEFKATTEFMKQLKTSTDFLVVTIVGPKHSGKSALLSYLVNESEKFDSEKLGVFEARGPKSERSSSFYITSDNIVFIEMSPIFNGFAAVEFIPQVSQYGSLENAVTSWNLRLMRWALVCSHLVIVLTSPSLVDPVVCQLVNSALSVYPMESVFGEGCHPELVFVGNKLSLPAVKDDKLRQNLNHIMTSPDIIGVSRVPRIVPNIYLLPHTKYNYGGYENIHFEKLKKSIMDFNRSVRNPFSSSDDKDTTKFPQRTTLIDWFGFASRLWEELGSPAVFSDYVNVVNSHV